MSPPFVSVNGKSAGPTQCISCLAHPPLQEDRMTKLPKKLLQMIIEDECLSRKDLRALALSSPNLFNLVQPRFYRSDNFATFVAAASHGDVAALERCAEFRAVPKNASIIIPSGCGRPKCTRTYCFGEYLNMIGAVAMNMQLGKVLPQDCIDTVQWLLKRGGEDLEEAFPELVWREGEKARLMEGEGTFEHCRFSGCLHPVIAAPVHNNIEGLFSQLLKRQSREKVGATCQLIELLVNQGAQMPRERLGWRFGPGEVNHDLGLLLGEAAPARDPVGIAMALHCPPSLLEFVLKTYERESHHLLDTPDQQTPIEPMRIPRTDLNFLVRCIHCRIFMPTGDWEEAYHGEVADMLKKKVDLLIQYGVVDEMEQEALQRLVAAVQVVYFQVGIHGWDMKRDGKKCWDILFEALHPTRLSQAYLPRPLVVRNHRFEAATYTPWLSVYNGADDPCLNNFWSPEIEWQYFMEWLKFWEASDKGVLGDIRTEFWRSNRCCCEPCQRRRS